MDIPQERKVLTQIPGPKSKEWMARRDGAMTSAFPAIHPIVSARASGAIIEDVDGNRLIDFATGIAVLNIGHAAPDVIGCGGPADRTGHPHGRRHRERADDRARRAAERAHARRLPEEDVLRQLRRGGGGERGEGGALRHRPPGDRLLRPRVPRADADGHDAHREGHAVQAGVRAVRAGDLPPADGVRVPLAERPRALRRRGARVRARRDAQAHRRAEHRRRAGRADPGRGRVHRPGARLPQGAGRLLRRARHRVHRRRDPERHGARGSLVRDRGRGRRHPRHRPHREVARRGVPDLGRDGARRPDGCGAPRRARRDVRRQPGRGSGRARGPRQDRARRLARTFARAGRDDPGALPRRSRIGTPPSARSADAARCVRSSW